MRQEIGEASKHHPTCGCAGKAAIETGIKDEVSLRVVIDCPQDANCVALKEGLGEVPDFASQPESAGEFM